jgi:hypothetical protein
MDVISETGAADQAAKSGLSLADRAHEQRHAWVLPGLPVGIVGGLGIAGGIALLFDGKGATVLGIVLLVISGLLLGGVFVVQPNESRVLILFGRYVGTLTEPRLWLANPFTVV